MLFNSNLIDLRLLMTLGRGRHLNYKVKILFVTLVSRKIAVESDRSGLIFCGGNKWVV